MEAQPHPGVTRTPFRDFFSLAPVAAGRALILWVLAGAAGLGVARAAGVPVLAMLAASAAPAGLQYAGGTVRIEGRVYAERGQNIPNARVHLESEEGDELFSTALTSEGRYEISGLRRATYRLTATAEGYEAFQETIDLTRTTSHVIVDIVMSPKVSGPAGPPPSLTDASAPKTARKEYEKGAKALEANRIPEARSHFSKAVEVYPCYARAETALASFLIADHEVADAEVALKKSIQCDAGFLSANLKLGELYNLERKFPESILVLEDGARRDPGLWKFHYQLGVAYYGAGENAKAEEEYLRAESLTPPAPAEVHVKLADVYSREKAYVKAYLEMQAYLRAEPSGQFAARVRNVMQQMESSGTVRLDSAAANAVPPSKP